MKPTMDDDEQLRLIGALRRKDPRYCEKSPEFDALVMESYIVAVDALRAMGVASTCAEEAVGRALADIGYSWQDFQPNTEFVMALSLIFYLRRMREIASGRQAESGNILMIEARPWINRFVADLKAEQRATFDVIRGRLRESQLARLLETPAETLPHRLADHWAAPSAPPRQRQHGGNHGME
jgi:hypothetical protein